MNGTSFSVTLPMRLIPPMRITSTSNIITIPIPRFTPDGNPFLNRPVDTRAESIAVVIVLTCVAFPVPNTVSTPNIEYNTASQPHQLLRPFLI